MFPRKIELITMIKGRDYKSEVKIRIYFCTQSIGLEIIKKMKIFKKCVHCSANSFRWCRENTQVVYTLIIKIVCL